MSLLDQLERKFGRFAFPNLLVFLLVGQVLVFMVMVTGQVNPGQLVLVGEGEWWRVFTFLVLPMSLQPLFFAIGLYVTWLMGSSLERQWGEFRFCLFLGSAWLLTVIASFFFPMLPMTNVYILGLLTLAFAKLFPEVQFLIFFVIPMKVKYIGWMMWAFYALGFVGGGMADRVQIACAMGTWLLFFGGEVVSSARNRSRRAKFQREARGNARVPFHTCEVCGKTNLTHPHIDFRYHEGKCVCASYLEKGECDEK